MFKNRLAPPLALLMATIANGEPDRNAQSKQLSSDLFLSLALGTESYAKHKVSGFLPVPPFKNFKSTLAPFTLVI